MDFQDTPSDITSESTPESSSSTEGSVSHQTNQTEQRHERKSAKKAPRIVQSRYMQSAEKTASKLTTVQKTSSSGDGKSSAKRQLLGGKMSTPTKDEPELDFTCNVSEIAPLEDTIPQPMKQLAPFLCDAKTMKKHLQTKQKAAAKPIRVVASTNGTADKSCDSSEDMIVNYNYYLQSVLRKHLSEKQLLHVEEETNHQLDQVMHSNQLLQEELEKLQKRIVEIELICKMQEVVHHQEEELKPLVDNDPGVLELCRKELENFDSSLTSLLKLGCVKGLEFPSIVQEKEKLQEVMESISKHLQDTNQIVSGQTESLGTVSEETAQLDLTSIISKLKLLFETLCKQVVQEGNILMVQAMKRK